VTFCARSGPGISCSGFRIFIFPAPCAVYLLYSVTIFSIVSSFFTPSTAFPLELVRQALFLQVFSFPSTLHGSCITQKQNGRPTFRCFTVSSQCQKVLGFRKSRRPSDRLHEATAGESNRLQERKHLKGTSSGNSGSVVSR
jgi:hypothetical protein